MAHHTHFSDDTEPITNARGEKVALGPLRRDLLATYRRSINDLETVRTLGAAPQPMTSEQEEAWYESQSKAENEAPFTIYALPELQPVGSAGLHEIDHRNRLQEAGPRYRDRSPRARLRFHRPRPA